MGETVWWVTLVDATLVRYHPRDYEKALADKDVRRRKTEGTLEGLRYVRNQLGKSVEPDEFVRPAVGDDAGWAWRPLPEPQLETLAPRARQWELSRYHAYQERLAGREIAGPSPAAPSSSPRQPRWSAAARSRDSVLALDHEERAADHAGQLRLLPRELEAAAASSSGTSMPSESLNPTARLPASAIVYITLIDRPDS